VAFSPDGKTLASGGGHETSKEKQSEVVIWNLAAGKPQASYQGHSAPVVALAFSPDGRTLATGSCDRTVKLWDTATGEERATLKGHADMVTSVAFSPDGKTLASAGWDRTVKLWDTASAKERLTLNGHTDVVWGVAFSPDSKLLASAGGDQTARLWDVATGQARATLDKHTDEVLAVAFSPDGKSLATAGMDNIRLWDPATASQQRVLPPQQDTGAGRRTYSLAFTSEGKLLAAAPDLKYKSVSLWDVTTGKLLTGWGGGAPTQVAFSPDGKVVATADRSGAVKVWDVGPDKAPWQASKRWKGFR
jgi:WD40 repeat protein